MTKGNFRRLPVVGPNNKLVGILSEPDLRQLLGALAQTKVNAAMTSPVVTIGEFDTAESAAKLMLKHKIGGLPVTDGERLVGIVIRTDLLRALLSAVEATQNILER
jgi:acetoin utilization protein AcuB